jgi:hypothetical protein
MEPIKAIADIIKNELGLTAGQIMLAYEKWEIAKNAGMYIDLAYVSQKVIGSASTMDTTLNLEVKTITVLSSIQVDILSYGDEARLRKEEVLMALNSAYSQSVQEANNISIGYVPTSMVNASALEESKFLNRFVFTINVTALFSVTKGATYFDSFKGTFITEQTPAPIPFDGTQEAIPQ